jgi:hypothetical protein
MTEPTGQPNSAPRSRRACPNCGSAKLRRLQEGEQEFVLTPKRECKDCGTVFSPPPSIGWAVPTFLMAAGLLVVGGWGTFFDDTGAAGALTDQIYWMMLVFGALLVIAGVAVVRHRTPKVHNGPAREGEARPWHTKREG